MKAIWNNQIIAESDNTEVVEGNHYFPADSIKREYFSDSDHTSVCPFKGEAKYYNVDVDGKVNENGAWYYPDPKAEFENIKGGVAFWNGITVEG